MQRKSLEQGHAPSPKRMRLGSERNDETYHGVSLRWWQGERRSREAKGNAGTACEWNGGFG